MSLLQEITKDQIDWTNPHPCHDIALYQADTFLTVLMTNEHKVTHIYHILVKIVTRWLLNSRSLRLTLLRAFH